MYQYIIKNALVYSGLKEEARKLDVAIQDDRIAKISAHIPSGAALQVVDADGLILCPGFIDPHASTGLGYYFPNAATHKLYQGVTTEIIGNCGTSTAPVGPHLVTTMEKIGTQMGFVFNWRTLGEYFDTIREQLPFNIATLIGHSSLRKGYLTDWQQPKVEEMQQMRNALRDSMKEGALGISTGLIYAPGCFAETQEIVDLAGVVKNAGGVYASHIRDERDKLEEAVDEALEIGALTKVPVLISHLKAAERQNWGKIKKVLTKIEAYNKKHSPKALVDVYPYTATSTKLRAFIPKYLLADGIENLPQKLEETDAIDHIEQWLDTKGYDLSQMLIISKDWKMFAGKTVTQVAEEQDWSLAQTIANILKTSTEVWVVYHCIDEKDMDEAILWEHSMICSDSWSYPVNAPNPIGEPHPRSYGAFTEFLERYVLQQKSLSWAEAIHKISYLPAQFFGLVGRGEIKEGNFADLILFDPLKVKANATYLEPRRLSNGVEHLWINGRMVIHHQELVAHDAGRVLIKS